jgi:hypothetical protein
MSAFSLQDRSSLEPVVAGNATLSVQIHHQSKCAADETHEQRRYTISRDRSSGKILQPRSGGI